MTDLVERVAEGLRDALANTGAMIDRGNGPERVHIFLAEAPDDLARAIIPIVLEEAAKCADARREMAELHRGRAEQEGSSRVTISNMRAMSTASEQIAARIRALAGEG